MRKEYKNYVKNKLGKDMMKDGIMENEGGKKEKYKERKINK